MVRPTRAEIVLPNLAHNLEAIRHACPAQHFQGDGPSYQGDGPSYQGDRHSCLSSDPPRIIAVIKANAYGHGAVEVGRELARLGVTELAVACLEEAVELNEAGVKARIVILGPLRREEAAELAARGFVPVISAFEDVAVLEAALEGVGGGERLSVMVEVDTGMGRMGLTPEDVPRLSQRLAASPRLELWGLMSHLAVSESDQPDDHAYTSRQIHDFSLIARSLAATFPKVAFVSIQNSGALGQSLEGMNAVRPGLALYGVRPGPGPAPGLALKPVMRLVTEIVQVRALPPGSSVSYGRKTVLRRPSRVAVLPVGYADGLTRRLPPGFPFFVRGHAAPLAGVITMDLTMIDVTDVPHARTGDRVLLLGQDLQPGPDGPTPVRVPAETHAAATATIPYEVLTSIGPRVKRVYLQELK